MGTFAWRPVAESAWGRWVRVPLRLPSPFGRASALLRSLFVAVAAITAGAAVQYLVLPRPSVAPFVFFFPAVAVVAWRSGRGAGLLTVLASALTANWLYVPPFGTPKLSGAELGATLLFVVGASPIALLCGALRARLTAAQRASAQLGDQAALPRAVRGGRARGRGAVPLARRELARSHRALRPGAAPPLRQRRGPPRDGALVRRDRREDEHRARDASSPDRGLGGPPPPAFEPTTSGARRTPGWSTARTASGRGALPCTRTTQTGPRRRGGPRCRPVRSTRSSTACRWRTGRIAGT